MGRREKEEERGKAPGRKGSSRLYGRAQRQCYPLAVVLNASCLPSYLQPLPPLSVPCLAFRPTSPSHPASRLLLLPPLRSLLSRRL